jgi:4-amino-4-deoxy-L-arabinose transferase-like glycosyltransferase
VRTAIALVGVAFALRAAFCLLVYPHVAEQFVTRDGYDEIAANLLAGRGFLREDAPVAAERLPIYPLLLAACYAAFGRGAWGWQLVQCGLGALTAWVVFMAASRYATRRSALVAGAVCAAHPTLILYTARPLTETLYTLLMALLAGAISPWRPRRAGFWLGLQLLVKSTALLQLVALLPVLARRGLASAARFTTVAAIVVVPWAAANLWTSGTPHLVSVSSGGTLYQGLYISRHVGWTTPTGDLNEQAAWELFREMREKGIRYTHDVAQDNRAAGALARAWIADHPTEVLQLWARNLVLTWYLGRSRLAMAVHAVLHAALLVGAFVGATRLVRRRPEERSLVVFAVVVLVAYTVVHAVIQPGVRYVLPAVPVMALLVAGLGARR